MCERERERDRENAYCNLRWCGLFTLFMELNGFPQSIIDFWLINIGIFFSQTNKRQETDGWA